MSEITSRRKVLLALAAASGSMAFARPAASQQARPVTIALSSSSLGTAAVRIAQELGLFGKHGLSARFTVMDSTNGVVAALISRSVDAAMAGPSTVIAAQARGQKIVTLANGYAGSATTMVLSKAAADKTGVAPDAPVAERLKATDGLLIATPDATSASTVSFKGAAAGVGVAMRFTYMAQQAMPVALGSGTIQGFLASAPYWAYPVASGSGLVWISGPKGELPAANSNTSSTALQVLRETAERDPDLARRYALVFADLRRAIDERPADVKAAVGTLFPELDGRMLELLYASESPAWNAPPLTEADMAREIAFVQAGGTAMPGLATIRPRDLVYP